MLRCSVSPSSLKLPPNIPDSYVEGGRFGYSFSMNGGKKPIVFAMLFALFLSVINGALACGWNVGKLSLNGIVPIVISMGTLKLNDRVPGSMTNSRKYRRSIIEQ